MQKITIDRLSPVQQIIIACVGESPGLFTRSEVAKLLVGSSSSRIAEFADNPYFGRLPDHGRKEITFEVDILLQQGYLALDIGNRLILVAGDPRN